MKKEIIAIIPARGGSEGIPNKNIRLLAGKPLIAHSIVQAQMISSISRVIVSTDSKKIVKTALKWKAEVVRRPSEISTSTASSESALLHVLDYLWNTEGYKPDIIVFLQCTSPLTSARDIQATIDTLIKNEADVAFTVKPFHYFIWKFKDKKAVAVNHNKSIRLTRQEKTPQYQETGSVYAIRTEGFIKARHRFFGKCVMYIIPPERCLEIDAPFDLWLAEQILQKKQLSVNEKI
ncbi:MAG: acylneuraminate cytidylyltransferase family protein [bacterium]